MDFERIKEIYGRRLIGRYPRFRQRVVESHVPLRSPTWEDDPDFDLEHHMHHLALPAPGDKHALQQLVSELMTVPLDRNRPLWQVYLVDGFGDGAEMITLRAPAFRCTAAADRGEAVLDRGEILVFGAR